MMPHVKSFEFLNRISLSRKHASILFYKQQAGELSVFRPQIAIYWQCLKHTLPLMPAMRDNENRFSTVNGFFLIRELLIVQNHWISHEGSDRERVREKRLNEECRQQHMCVLLIKNKIQFYIYITLEYKVEGKSHSIYCK